MTIVGSTVATAGYRRAKLRNTLLLGLFLLYTFFPLYYLVVASTKSNLDLFSTFGLWFASDFDLVANLKDLSASAAGCSGAGSSTRSSTRPSRRSERRWSRRRLATPSRNSTSLAATRYLPQFSAQS